MADWREAAKIRLVKAKQDKQRLIEMSDRLYEQGLLWSGEKALLDEQARLAEKEIKEIEFDLLIHEMLSSDEPIQTLIDNLHPPKDDSDLV